MNYWKWKKDTGRMSLLEEKIYDELEDIIFLSCLFVGVITIIVLIVHAPLLVLAIIGLVIGAGLAYLNYIFIVYLKNQTKIYQIYKKMSKEGK